MNPGSFAAALACVVALAGCGLKGPLYLPEKPGEVVTRPGPSSSPSAPAPGTAPSTATPEPPAAPASDASDTAPPPLPPAPGDRTGG